MPTHTYSIEWIDSMNEAPCETAVRHSNICVCDEQPLSILFHGFDLSIHSLLCKVGPPGWIVEALRAGSLLLDPLGWLSEYINPYIPTQTPEED